MIFGVFIGGIDTGYLKFEVSAACKNGGIYHESKTFR